MYFAYIKLIFTLSSYNQEYLKLLKATFWYTHKMFVGDPWILILLVFIIGKSLIARCSHIIV